MLNSYEDAIYVIIGDDGYGMVIKKKKAERIAALITNSFIKKFTDAIAGYLWLSSQINDYSEPFYGSTRVLMQSDLVSLDELIRRQYVVLSVREAKKRGIGCSRNDEPLRIVFGTRVQR